MTFYYDAELKTLTNGISDPVPLASLAGALFPGSSMISSLLERITAPGKMDGENSKIVRDIIAEGRKQQVDEMEIEMDREVALGLNLQGLENVDVMLGAKGKTRYQIKIKYK